MAIYPHNKPPARGRPERISRGLGWFSVGVGIAQILAPRAMARITGVPAPASLVVLCGLRELACGVGLLTQEEPAPWIRARIAGDALDLAAFGAAALVPGTHRTRLGLAAGAVAGVTALDVYCARELGLRGKRRAPRHETISIHVDRAPAELYAFWRDFANLPLVMQHVRSVEVIDATRSRWVSAGPPRSRVQWEAEIIDDLPGRRIAWRSVDDSVVFNAGSVQFAGVPEGGTRVDVELLYDLPEATLGVALARLVGFDPAQEGRADLEAFKNALESRKNPDNPRLMA